MYFCWLLQKGKFESHILILPQKLLMGHPRLLFHLFSDFFKQTIQILQQINVKNVHPVSGAGIQTHDLLSMNLLL